MSDSIVLTLDNIIYSEKDLALIDLTFIPQHIAIVMDGNRRWAKTRMRSIKAGYCQGAKQLDVVVRAATELGVKALTLYSFSTENWKRREEEVNILMDLMKLYLSTKRDDLLREGVCLHTIGDLSRFPDSLKQQFEEAVQATQNGKRIDLILALNYGGRDEMRRAFLKMFQATQKGELEWKKITEQTISSYLDTAQWSDPELVIRSSGEWRVSNFLMWQTAYSEVVVLNTLWPDFSPQDLLQAIIEYQRRQRRFGG